MNCKPGDLAAIAFCPRGTEHLRGRVVKLTTRGPDSPQYSWRMSLETRATWRYEGAPLLNAAGSKILYLNDCCLRPIRDQPGDDETLTWAGKPNELPADIIREVAA